MRASACAILAADDAVAANIRAAIPRDVAFEEHVGWDSLPAYGRRLFRCDYVILDTRGQDPIAAVQRLQGIDKQEDDKEIEVIVAGDADHAVVYRELKHMEVAEYTVVGRDDVAAVVGATLERLETQRRSRGQAVDPRRIVAVVGLSGGAGTSTIAAAIARRSAGLARTLLLETRLSGVQHLAFDIQPSPSFSTMIRDPERIDALLLERQASRAGDRMGVLSADEPFDDPSAWSEGGLRAVTACAVAAGFERIVIDGRCDEVGRRALLAAGTEVVVAMPTMQGLKDAIRMLSALHEHFVERRVLLVLNRTGEFGRAAIPTKEFAERIGREVLEIPYDKAAVARALLCGLPVADKSKAGRALDTLVCRVLEITPPKKSWLASLLEAA